MCFSPFLVPLPPLHLPPYFPCKLLSQLADNDTPQSIYTSLLTLTNCTSLPCLRSIDFDTLREVNYNLTTGAFFGTFIMAPVVDGEFVRRTPLEAVGRGEVNVVSDLSFLYLRPPAPASCAKPRFM